MIRVDPLCRDNDRFYDDVAASREPHEVAVLTNIGPSVKQAYRTYRLAVSVDATRAPESILADPDDLHGEVLRDGWKVLSRVAYRRVRSDLLSLGDGLCVLCANATSGAIDHYLPKSLFPEFTILTDNLAPVCGRCNGKKLARYRASGGGPAFVHPYFHELPDEDFLICNVVVRETVLVAFDVIRTPSMSRQLYSVLRSHFDRLGLAIMYQDEAVSLMRDQLNAYYHYHRALGANGLAELLRVNERSVRARYAPVPQIMRHWKPVFLEALAASADFCNGGFATLGPEVALD